MAPIASRTEKPSLLVAGATGFIASHLLRRLRADAHEVVALSRRPLLMNDVTSVVADELTPDDYARLLRTVDGIVWLAGVSTPSSSAGQPLRELDGNLRPLLALLEASAAMPPKRMVFVSTGGAIYGDVMEHNASEASQTEPKSYYSAGKAAAEAFLSAWAHEGKHDVTVLRPSNVYGPGQPFRPGFGIVPTVFHAATSGEPVVIRGDGEAVRDYLYVSDLIDLVMDVVRQPVAEGMRIFNASSSLPVPLNHLLDTIDQITGKPVKRTYRPATPYDVHRVVLDNGKAKAAFGWCPQITLRDGLERSWNANR